MLLPVEPAATSAPKDDRRLPQQSVRAAAVDPYQLLILIYAGDATIWIFVEGCLILNEVFDFVG